ncbi:hypothetical protein GCM10011515_16280 [Tsuneonella deserti]|uniref:Calpastatin n=1 Tax=Tsuneonella deserti TaxID=2035528 RepID=A0ABQ1S7L8_9SPHN|nr:DUF1810 domain-containing protein [Tsuneonella deserti]GGD97216.1 hypothetical protein GCM10011515_16280 [Tsuneonella deserti]
MGAGDPPGSRNSPLERFLLAQSGGVYERALEELGAGRKRSHWMWFVFPQLAGLGRSEMAANYAIADLAEARAYLGHPVLGSRIVECTGTVLRWGNRRSAEAIFGNTDAMKLRSSLTLFERASESKEPFSIALETFFAGERDRATLCML